MAPLAAAAPYIVGGTALAGISQAGAIGKFNQDVSNRNALVKENEAKILDDKLALDLSRFNKAFEKLEGTTNVALAKSGVVMDSGSAYNIQLSNAYEAQLQKQLIKYNSQVAAANKMEEANFARISGVIARNEAKLAQISTIAQTGTSLLAMSNKSKT